MQMDVRAKIIQFSIYYGKLKLKGRNNKAGIVIENYPTYIITAEGNVQNATGIFTREKIIRLKAI